MYYTGNTPPLPVAGARSFLKGKWVSVTFAFYLFCCYGSSDSFSFVPSSETHMHLCFFLDKGTIITYPPLIDHKKQAVFASDSLPQTHAIHLCLDLWRIPLKRKTHTQTSLACWSTAIHRVILSWLMVSTTQVMEGEEFSGQFSHIMCGCCG